MAVGVCKMIALVLQRLARRIVPLPPCSPSPHEVKDVALVHPHVCHPTAVLDCVSAHFPVRNAMHPHVRVRCMERHVIDQAKPMHNTHGAVMPLRSGDASGVLGRLSRLAQRGVITFFDSEDSVETVVVKGVDRRGIGTEAVCS